MALVLVARFGQRDVTSADPDALPPITSVAIDRGGQFAVVGSQSGLKVYGWPDLKLQRTLPTELTHIHDLAFSPDGSLLAATGGDPAESGTLELLHWPSGKLHQRASKHTDLVCSVAWKFDSSEIAVGSADKLVTIFDRQSGDARRVLAGHSRAVLAVEYLPQNLGLMTAGVDESLRLWVLDSEAVEAPKPRRTFTNHTRQVYGLALRPAEPDSVPVVASIGEDGTVRLWQPTIGRLMRFARLKSAPLAITWTFEGKAIAVSCRDGYVRIVDPDTVEVREEILVLDGAAYSLASAADSSLLVGGENGHFRRVLPRPLQPELK